MQVRKMHVKDALINMSIRSEKKAALMVKEAIRSAYFNAINNHSMDANKLTVGEIDVSLIPPLPNHVRIDGDFSSIKYRYDGNEDVKQRYLWRRW